MIRGLHGLFYSSDAAATRAFMRDALRLPATDVGEGWLIFDLPECDVGVHPTAGHGDEPPANTHDVSFFCDDIQGTVADLRSRGVELRSDPEDHGYGWVTHFTMPGGVEVQLYEPKYQKAPAAKPAAAKPAAKKAGARKAVARPAPAAGKPAAKKAAKKAAAKPAPAARKPTAARPAAKKPAAKPAPAAKKPARR
jgi:predicted enzyme related to lactoylglutathione lyase